MQLHTQESQESLSSPCNGCDRSGCVSERPLSGHPHASAHCISDVPLSTGGESMQHSCVGHSGPGPVCQGGRTVHCSKNVRSGVRVYYLNCAASGVGDVLAVSRCRWAVLYVSLKTQALVVFAFASALARAAVLLARRVVILLARRVVILLARRVVVLL
jgi:hypothetical protein